MLTILFSDIILSVNAASCICVMYGCQSTVYMSAYMYGHIYDLCMTYYVHIKHNDTP